MKEIKLTEKGAKVLIAMKENGLDSVDKAVLSKDIAALAFLLPAGVPGVLTSLARNGLVGKTEDTPKKYFLTQDGVDFNL